MDNEKMSQAYADICNATGIAEATLKTIFNDNSVNDRLEWVIIGVVEQIDKIKKAAKTIDKEMSAREDCTA